MFEFACVEYRNQLLANFTFTNIGNFYISNANEMAIIGAVIGVYHKTNKPSGAQQVFIFP